MQRNTTESHDRARPGAAAASFPFSPGRMAAHVRARDWSATPLGPAEGWPASLRYPLELCLETKFPAAILWGPEYRVFLNDAYVEMLGDGSETALGEPLFEAWPAHRPMFEPYLERVRENGESVELRNLAIRTRDGDLQESVFEIGYSPVRDERGGVAGVFVSVHESTEHADKEKKWQQEQSNSRAFLDSLIENLPNMVFVKDAKDLRFVRFNRAGEELLGMSRAELIGKNDFDFFPSEQAKHFTSFDRAVLAGRSIVDIPEEPIQTRRGLRYLHTRKIPLLGPDGTPQYLLGISDDITEKRQAEAERLKLTREEAAVQEREAANRRVSLLADASVALSASLDYRETLQKLASLVVPALADWCSVTIRERDGSFRRVAGDHHDAARRPLVDELLQFAPNCAATKIMDSVEFGKPLFLPELPDEQLEKAAQSPRHLEILRRLGTKSCMLVPIRGRERTHGVLAFQAGDSGRTYTQDDLRTAEELGRRAGAAIDNALLYLEAQAAVASRDAFLSIASHELKTPLTSLTLQTQMRRRHLDRGNFAAFTHDKLIHMIEADARQLDRLTRLIDDMLDISRISSGKLTIHPEPVNLLQLVREVAERQADQYAKAGCDLLVAGDDSVLGMWDRYRIEQVVTNLLSNALKYGGGRPVTVTVSQSGGNAVLEVRDRGIGIAPQDQERIFRQFERAVGPNGVSGLGLGLYIVKQILELHGGAIRVKSAAAEGATFIVTLPAC